MFLTSTEIFTSLPVIPPVMDFLCPAGLVVGPKDNDAFTVYIRKGDGPIKEINCLVDLTEGLVSFWNHTTFR